VLYASEWVAIKNDIEMLGGLKCFTKHNILNISKKIIKYKQKHKKKALENGTLPREGSFILLFYGLCLLLADSSRRQRKVSKIYQDFDNFLLLHYHERDLSSSSSFLSPHTISSNLEKENEENQSQAGTL